MTRYALVGTGYAVVARRWALLAVAALGLGRVGVAQEQFDGQLGVDPATRESTEIVPDAEAAAGIKTEGEAGGVAGSGAPVVEGTIVPGASTPGVTYEPFLDSSARASASPATEAARLAIWNSREMQSAREYIAEYGRRSREFTSTDATAYLERLSQFTPDEMKAWLARYEARRATNQRNAEVARAARQTAVAANMQRLQSIQQAQQNASQLQNVGALNARAQYGATQHIAQTASAYKQLNRDLYLGAMQAGNAYDYFVNPPLYVQMAASASLPGNLPAGDPRNFIRGDVPGAGAAGAIERNAGGGRGR